jgi:hypothetical protein
LCTNIYVSDGEPYIVRFVESDPRVALFEYPLQLRNAALSCKTLGDAKELKTWLRSDRIRMRDCEVITGPLHGLHALLADGSGMKDEVNVRLFTTNYLQHDGEVRGELGGSR